MFVPAAIRCSDPIWWVWRRSNCQECKYICKESELCMSGWLNLVGIWPSPWDIVHFIRLYFLFRNIRWLCLAGDKQRLANTSLYFCFLVLMCSHYIHWTVHQLQHEENCLCMVKVSASRIKQNWHSLALSWSLQLLLHVIYLILFVLGKLTRLCHTRLI